MNTSNNYSILILCRSRRRRHDVETADPANSVEDDEIPIDSNTNVANMIDVESFRLIIENRDVDNCLSVDVFRDYIFEDVFTVGPSSTMIKYMNIGRTVLDEMLNVERVQSLLFKVHRERDGQKRTRMAKLIEKWNRVQIETKRKFEIEYEIDPAASFIRLQHYDIDGDRLPPIRFSEKYDILKIYLHYSAEEDESNGGSPDLVRQCG